MSPSGQLLALLNQWGIEKTHVAASCLIDWEPLVEKHPDRLASLTVVFPSAQGNPKAPLSAITHRLLGDSQRNQRFLHTIQRRNIAFRVTHTAGYDPFP